MNSTLLHAVKRIEIDPDSNVRCPFCDELVLNMDALNSDDETINPITPCPHTLFLATDEGYEFKRDDVIVNDEDEDDGFDTMTDSVNKLNAIKICQYEGAPSGMGSYIGFSEN